MENKVIKKGLSYDGTQISGIIEKYNGWEIDFLYWDYQKRASTILRIKTQKHGNPQWLQINLKGKTTLARTLKILKEKADEMDKKNDK